MRHETYVCLRASSPIEIDGDIGKSAWANAPWTADFQDIKGDPADKPPYRTRVKLLWDDRCLYIAAELEEPHLWATYTKCDSVIFMENDFEFFVDPDRDSHHYAELEINALGTIWDLLMPRPYKDGGMPMSGWQFKGLEIAVRLRGSLNDPADTDDGWSIEIAIPWSGIKETCRCACPPKDGDQWGINFSRVQWDLEVVDGRYRKTEGKPEHNWVWSPPGVVDLHRPELWGVVQFSKAASGRVAFVPDPSEEARELLHAVYYAQRQYRAANGNWAQNIEDIHLSTDSVQDPKSKIQNWVTPNYFEAAMEVAYPDGTTHEWHVGSDGAIWEGESYESKCVRGECEFRPDFGSDSIDHG